MPHGAIPFPFGDCRICNDKATGFHYGVATCEGCKGFFKRSIPKGDMYTCFFGGHCTITPFNRNRCKACRFKRCLDNGMAIDAVKMGRIPKVEKERALLENRLQTRSDHHIEVEEGDINMSSSYSWSESTRSQDMLAQENSHGGHISRIDARSEHGSVSKDWTHNDIPLGPPKLLAHAPKPTIHAHRSYSCEGREMPELISEWKNCHDLKSSVDLNYKGETINSHHLSEHATSFSTSDPALYQDFLGSDHLMGNAKGHTASRSSKGFFENAQHNSARMFHSSVIIKTEPDCSYGNEPNGESWDGLYAQPSEISCHSAGTNLSRFPLENCAQPLLGDCRAVSSWGNSFDDAESDTKCEIKRVQPIQPFNLVEKGAAGLDVKEPHRLDKDRNMSALTPTTPAPCQSSYSPDIIKVLLDQVGGERIKGIQHHIMTTVAKTFGPEEYEATKQLLSSYTERSEQKPTEPATLSYREPDKPFRSSGISQAAGNTSQPFTTFGAGVNAMQPKPMSDHTDSIPIMNGLALNHQGQWCAETNCEIMGPFPRDKVNSSKHDSDAGLLSNAELMETEDGLTLCSSDELSNGLLGDQYESLMNLGASDKVASSIPHNLDVDKDSTSPRGLDELSMSACSQTLLKAYEKHMDVLVKRYDSMNEFIKNKSSLPTHPLTSEGKDLVYNLIISGIPEIIRCIIGFCQDVPGFATLAKGDKELLIKRGYYDIWIMTNSKLFYDNESYLQLVDGTFYTRAWMEKILSPIIVDKIISFTNKFNKLELSNLELAILCAIQLTASGHEPLEFERAESIQQVNGYYLDLLVEEVSKRRPAYCSRILLDLFRLLPDLIELNRLQREIIASMSTEGCPEKVDYKPEFKASLNENDLAIFDQC